MPKSQKDVSINLKSAFGTLKPKLEEVVKDFLEKDGEVIGYMTGYLAFNRLGLTTQVPNIIQIGTNVRKNKTVRGMFTISFVIQSNPITKENIPLLQLLDAIKFIKEIPDTTTSQLCKCIMTIIQNLDKKIGMSYLCLQKNILQWCVLYLERWLRAYTVQTKHCHYGIH